MSTINSIYDIVRQGMIGSLTVGQDLRELSNILAPPKGWIFPYDGPLDGILDYGPLEIFIKSVADNVEIYLIKLHLLKAVGRNILIPLRGHALFEIQRPLKTELDISTVRSVLKESEMKFTSNSQLEIENGARPYFQFGSRSRIYFSGGRKAYASYIEICNYF